MKIKNKYIYTSFLKIDNMKKKELKSFLTNIFLLAIFILYAWIRVENSQYIREPRATFGDTSDYFQIASISIFSSSFWLSVKPPVVPLILKVLGDNIFTISTYQLWFSILCWGLLSYVVTKALQFDFIKPIAFSLILAFSMSEEIIMWDYVILSDSFALSILALFMTSCLWTLLRWNAWRATLLIVLAIILAFTRDTYAYVLLMVAAGLFVLFIVSKFKKEYLFVSAVFTLLFICSNALANAGLHWYTPLLNTIDIRILPNPEYLAYFEARGMPVSDALLERSGQPHHAGYGEMILDERLETFRKWVRENGKSEYTRFIWFYKEDSLQNVFTNMKPVFYPDLYFYAATRFRPIIQDDRIDELLYPNRFGFILFLASNLVAAALSVVAYYEKQGTWILPLMLILLTYPQAFLIWNADASDMARHSMYHNVMMRLGVWILIIFVLDFLLKKIIFRAPNLTKKNA